jgi:signal transduction histidine kinase
MRPNMSGIPACLRSALTVSAYGAWIVVVILLLVTRLAHGDALAPGRDRALFELHHTSWTAKDGAPGDVNVLAQTTDGYIWLGTATGLYRFDGIHFERYAPLDQKLPARIVESLYATPDNGLLVGFRDGGASLIRDGVVSVYLVAGDVKEMSTVRSFAITRDGVVWAAANNGLFRLIDSRWQLVGAEWAYPWLVAQTLFVDRSGTLWVAGSDSVVFLREGETQFRTTAERVVAHPFDINGILQAPDGAMWIEETSNSIRPLAIQHPSTPHRRPEIIVGSYGAIFDEAGCLWIASLGDGVGRVCFPEKLQDSKTFQTAAEIFSDKNGLTSNYAPSILEDREGNVWVGTSAGLDRFQSSNVVLSAFPSKVNDMILIAGDHGDIWSGGLNWEFSHLDGSRLTTLKIPEAWATACGLRNPDGTFWLGGPTGLAHVVDGRFYFMARPKEIENAWVTSVAKDKFGALWVVSQPGGLFRIVNGVWTTVNSQPRAFPRNLYADAEGRIWVGYLHGYLAVFENGKARVFQISDGITVGNVTAIYEHRANIWIGGETGLELYREGNFHRIIAANSAALWRISGIVESSDGDLWLNTASGIVQIQRSELERSLQNGSYRVAIRQFGYLDGLPGTSAKTRARPTVVQGSDGRIWFSVANGIAWIDPAHILKNSIPPPVYITDGLANGKEYPIGGNIDFPAHTRNIRIAYTGLSYTVPERVQFRYRLDGLESDWEDPGTRREAIYTNLRPGRYRFRVIASNNDGVWNEAGALLDFSIAPAFYQMTWFYASCAAVLLLLLLAGYQLRIRHLQRQFAIGLEARVNERTRIAREFHDTLLQSFQGLILKFQRARNVLPGRPEQAMALLDAALDKAEHAISEGRDAIHDIRDSMSYGSDLAEVVSALQDELTSENDATDLPTFQVITEGVARAIDPVNSKEIYRITREALRNAYYHARARNIEAEIRYEEKLLTVRIRDDGIGIDEHRLGDSGHARHFGLQGMRERATRIGAQLDIWSQQGSGTEIELRVPDTIAYNRRDHGNIATDRNANRANAVKS